jgi:ubiquinone biosynthesis protein
MFRVSVERSGFVEPSPFRLLRNIGRTSEIVTVLLNHGFGDMLDRIGVRNFWYRWRKLFSRKQQEPLRHLRLVERIRMTLEKLGPTFIKFGQVMSTRPDLVPPEMLTELQKLQEGVPPFSSEEAVAELERELGQPVELMYASFDRAPLAAGSLGQVHRATHLNGMPLAVKIRRPTAVRDVERDLLLMQEMAILLERNVAEARVFDPVGLVNHFARTIRRELNFSREARTMDEFRRLFSQDATLYVPQVFWPLTTDAVITMEYVDGYKVDELSRLRNVNWSAADVAANGARIFMKQVFEFGVFHGDPHPGNIRVMRDGTLCLLDYGMIGNLDDQTREQLVDLLIAVTQRDVDAAVKLVLTIGEPYREVDRPLLQIDVRDFVSNYYGIELERLNVGNLLKDFVAILSNHSIRCPGSLMLLIRCFITLEGVGGTLDPDFNLATHLQPFVERLVHERYSPSHMLERVFSESRHLLGYAYEIPTHVTRTLRKLSEDDLRIQLEHRNLDHFILELERSSNRLVVGLVVASLIVASALIISQGASTIWVTLPTYVISSLLAIWLVYGIFRSGRL